jgi:hypothetical protein
MILWNTEESLDDRNEWRGQLNWIIRDQRRHRTETIKPAQPGLWLLLPELVLC